MIVSSGLKTAVTVAMIGTIGTKDGNYRNIDVATFIAAVQDIAAVCGSHCRGRLVELYKEKTAQTL